MDRGARVWLDWSRTVIGGKASPYDFAASFMQDTVGRILKTLHGKEAGTWFWTCYEGGANGKVSTKDEAVVGVERAYSAITRLPLLGDAIAFPTLQLFDRASVREGYDRMSIRHYLFPEDSEPLRLSQRLVEGMVFGKDALPQYAGTRQKVASVTLEIDGAKPQRILSAQGAYWIFDAAGDIRKGLATSTGDIMTAAFGSRDTTGTVVALQPKLSKKRAEDEHRWTVGSAELDRIAADIWSKSKSDRLKSAKGVSVRRPPLTYDARQALDEASADLWKISHAIDKLKEPSLKGFAHEARSRSVARPEHAPLYQAMAQMADERLEILRRRRVGKGVWYALVDTIMWDDNRVGHSLGRFHEKCEGKQAAVVAARKLLAQHAGDFAENITVEAEVLTDLEWQARCVDFGGD